MTTVYKTLLLLFVLDVLFCTYEIGLLFGNHNWTNHYANLCRDVRYLSNLALIWALFPKAEYSTELDPMKLEISPPLPSSARRCGVILDIEQYYAHMPHTAECFLRATSVWLDKERLGLNTDSTVWLAPIKYNIEWSRDVMA